MPGEVLLGLRFAEGRQRVIVRQLELQILTCDICLEVIELRRSELRDPEALMIAVQGHEADHRPCEEFKDDRPRAKREREFILRMRAEVRKQSRRRQR